MVVVDQRDCPCYVISLVPFFFYEFLPYKIPKCLGTILIVALSYIAIKFIEKSFVERNPESE